MIEVSTYYAVFLVHLFAVASPGPGFLVATKSSLSGGIRSGLLTALGIAFGDLVLLLISLLGTSALISSYPKGMSLLQALGAMYLVYIGIKSVKSYFLTQKAPAPISSNTQISQRSPFKDGFITTVLNPKAIIYFMSLTAQIIRPERGVFVNFILCSLMIAVTFFWFSFISLVVGNQKVQKKLTNHLRTVDGILGALLILLGVYIIYPILINWL